MASWPRGKGPRTGLVVYALLKVDVSGRQLCTVWFATNLMRRCGVELICSDRPASDKVQSTDQPTTNVSKGGADNWHLTLLLFFQLVRTCAR